VVIGKNESMIVDPCDSIWRLDNFMGIGSHMTHGRAPSFRLKLLNSRVCADFGGVEKLSRNWVN
jgi:hypothetical protein